MVLPLLVRKGCRRGPRPLLGLCLCCFFFGALTVAGPGSAPDAPPLLFLGQSVLPFPGHASALVRAHASIALVCSLGFAFALGCSRSAFPQIVVLADLGPTAILEECALVVLLRLVIPGVASARRLFLGGASLAMLGPLFSPVVLLFCGAR